MANFLNHLGRALSLNLKKSSRSRVYINTRVDHIQMNQNSTMKVFLKDKTEQQCNESLTSRNVILSMGGSQNLKKIIKRDIINSVNLKEFKDRVILSSELLSEDPKTLEKVRKENFKESNIAIIGGSHSAWSCAWYLLNNFKHNFLPGAIKILHRSPIKLFYPSVVNALQDGYLFDEKLDVCTLSGRVNRFSGLRGDSFDLARKVMKQEEKIVQTQYLKNSTPFEIETILRNSIFIIPAYGYEANTVPILDHYGKDIRLAYDDSGLKVDEHARVICEDGTIIRNILAYGLGAGMRPSEKIGGEKNLGGRIDGIWVFQNDVGKVVLSTLFNNLGFETAV